MGVGGPSGVSSSRGRRPFRALFGTDRASVHWTFGSVALLLVFVNLLTPSLLGGGLSAGSTFLAQGVITVDLSTNGNLSFLVEGSGHVMFAQVSIGLDRSPAVFPGNSSSLWTWNTWSNGSLVVAGIMTVNGTLHFILNVTTVYLAAAPASAPPNSVEATISRGVFAFALAPPGSTWGLTVFPLYPLSGPATIPGGDSKSLWSASALPQTLPLAEFPAVTVPASMYPTGTTVPSGVTEGPP
jgi:hypothetical protein